MFDHASIALCHVSVDALALSISQGTVCMQNLEAIVSRFDLMVLLATVVAALLGIDVPNLRQRLANSFGFGDAKPLHLWLAS